MNSYQKLKAENARLRGNISKLHIDIRTLIRGTALEKAETEFKYKMNYECEDMVMYGQHPILAGE